jgi:hypothetical protein
VTRCSDSTGRQWLSVPLHAPRLFPEYDADYFAAFVRDPDGHNIEAVCRLPARPGG